MCPYLAQGRINFKGIKADLAEKSAEFVACFAIATAHRKNVTFGFFT
jgi:hypothetical protein